MLPHTFFIRSICLSLLAWTDSPGYVGLAAGTGLNHMAILAPHRQPCVLGQPVLQVHVGAVGARSQTCKSPQTMMQ